MLDCDRLTVTKPQIRTENPFEALQQNTIAASDLTYWMLRICRVIDKARLPEGIDSVML